MGLATCRVIHVLKQKKRANLGPEAGREVPNQGDGLGTGGGGSWSLGKEVFRPKAHCYAAKWGGKTARRGLPVTVGKLLDAF